jgi:hypothetical protein
MAMQPRERNLAILLGGVAVVFVLYWGFSTWAGMFSSRNQRLADLKDKIGDKERTMLQVKQAIARRSELEKRSLPTNRELAQSLYHNWLLSTVEGSKLGDINVSPKASHGTSKAFDKLSFTVTGQGTLEQVTKLLFDFYATNYLHQIRFMTVKPVEKSTKLNLTMTVEALILPGAVNKERLPADKGDHLVAAASAEEYRKAIVGRNIFAEYTPPPVQVARQEKRDPPFDSAKLAFITTIVVGTDGRAKAFLHERNLDKTTHLHEGDPFEVSSLKGTVKRIDFDRRQVEMDVAGKSFMISMGRSLGDQMTAQKTQ